MRCPKCQAACPPFATREGVEMNFCRGCKGLWFDQGELQLYAEGEYAKEAFAAALAKAGPTVYFCPRCEGQPLVEFAYEGAPGLMVDACGQCHGVFLDAKELAQVETAEALKATAAARMRRAAEWLKSTGLVTIGVKR